MSTCVWRSIAATFSVFLVVVIANVMPIGLGHPQWGKLILAVGLIVACVTFAAWRVRAFRRLDELQQRMELEGLAAAFSGSFLIFWSYWLLQITGLLPPLNGMYFVLGMVALVGLGNGSAWGRLAKRGSVRS